MAPVVDLVLSKDIGYEFTVDQVTFIESGNFRRKRKRFGLTHPILVAQPHGVLKRFFEDGQTFGTLRRTGRGDECEQQFIRLLNEELAILAASQTGLESRRSTAAPKLATNRAQRARSYLLLDEVKGAWIQPNVAIPPFARLRLDSRWNELCRRIFFARLLEVIRGRVPVHVGWRRALRTASIFAGQSQCSSDVSQAFLWNMVALEILLIGDGDKFKVVLPQRCCALFGGSPNWAGKMHGSRIEDLVVKRNDLVHRGATDSIILDDLEFSDRLLCNVFASVVRHPKIFSSKTALVEFCKDVEAEKRLGLRRRVRPKNMGIVVRL